MAKKKQKPSRFKQDFSKPIRQTQTQNEEVNHALWIGLCLLLTLLAYLPVFSADFVNWDDGDYVFDNTWIRSFSNFTKFFTEPVQGNFHPLTMISLAINYAVSGNDAWSYHVLNLLLHLANTGLAYWLAWRLSCKKFWVAAATGLLFGLHPMHVESVAWVSERKDVLYAFFFLLGLLAYLRRLENPTVKNYLVFTGWFVLSLMSKPAAVVFPVILLAMDYWQNRPLRFNLLVEKIPHFALSLAMGYLTLHAQTLKGATDLENLFPFSTTIFFGFYAFMMYWVKLIFPVNLCTFYPFPTAHQALPMAYYLSPLFAVGIAVIIYWKRKQAKVPLFALAFFLVNIALVLQFFIVGSTIIADRYTYIPYFGAFFLAGFGIHYLVVEKKALSRQAAFGIIGVVAVLLLFLSTRQARTWKSGETLWDQAIKAKPSARAYVNRATLHRKAKENEKAFALSNLALQLDQREDQAYNIRGNVYFDNRDYEKAIEDFNKAIEINPGAAEYYNNRGASLGALGQYEKALADFSKGLSLDPDNARSYNNRGFLFEKLGRYPEAIEDYNRYLASKPEDADVWNSLGLAYQNTNQAAKALESYSKAIQLNPEQGIFWLNRSRLFQAMGNNANALSDAQQARQLGLPVPPEYLLSLQQ